MAPPSTRALPPLVVPPLVTLKCPPRPASTPASPSSRKVTDAVSSERSSMTAVSPRPSLTSRTVASKLSVDVESPTGHGSSPASGSAGSHPCPGDAADGGIDLPRDIGADARGEDRGDDRGDDQDQPEVLGARLARLVAGSALGRVECWDVVSASCERPGLALVPVVGGPWIDRDATPPRSRRPESRDPTSGGPKVPLGVPESPMRSGTSQPGRGCPGRSCSRRWGPLRPPRPVVSPGVSWKLRGLDSVASLA